MVPRMDLALLILIFTLVSLFSSVVMVEPRYLNTWVNWTFLLFGRMRSGGRLLSVVSSFAFLREFGKFMAFVFDLVLFSPTCICIPSLWKCWTRIGVRVSNSVRLSEINTLSSAKKTLLKLKGVPLEEVGCPIRRPLLAFRLPFLGGWKKQNSDALTLVFKVSKKACIMYVKSIGEQLSPCWIVSFPSLQLTVQLLYIFFTTLIRASGIPYFFRMSKRSGCCTVSKALTRSTKRVYVSSPC